MPLTSYGAKKALDHLLGKAAWTMPAGSWLALLTADPGKAGSFANEVGSGKGYARVAVTSIMGLTNDTTGTSVNGSAINFGTATVDWGTATHAAIVDAATGGNMEMYGPLGTARTFNAGESAQLAPGQLILTLT